MASLLDPHWHGGATVPTDMAGSRKWRRFFVILSALVCCTVFLSFARMLRMEAALHAFGGSDPDDSQLSDEDRGSAQKMGDFRQPSPFHHALFHGKKKTRPATGHRGHLTATERPDVPTVPGSISKEPPIKAIVLGHTRAENVQWLESGELKDWQKFAYAVDDPSAELHTLINKGHEALPYLTFIIDHYDKLPDVTVFLHSHMSSWHIDEATHKVPRVLSHLQLPYIERQGYANLRCGDTCFNDTMLPYHLRIKSSDIYAREIPNVFDILWGADAQLPANISSQCCANFAVSRERIRARPLTFYRKLVRWLVTTHLTDRVSGRVLEHMWHIIFGQDAIDCPPVDKCYCDLMGYCPDKDGNVDTDYRPDDFYKHKVLDDDGWNEFEEATVKGDFELSEDHAGFEKDYWSDDYDTVRGVHEDAEGYSEDPWIGTDAFPPGADRSHLRGDLFDEDGQPASNKIIFAHQLGSDRFLQSTQSSSPIGNDQNDDELGEDHWTDVVDDGEYPPDAEEIDDGSTMDKLSHIFQIDEDPIDSIDSDEPHLSEYGAFPSIDAQNMPTEGIGSPPGNPATILGTSEHPRIEIHGKSQRSGSAPEESQHKRHKDSLYSSYRAATHQDTPARSQGKHAATSSKQGSHKFTSLGRKGSLNAFENLRRGTPKSSSKGFAYNPIAPPRSIRERLHKSHGASSGSKPPFTGRYLGEQDDRIEDSAELLDGYEE